MLFLWSNNFPNPYYVLSSIASFVFCWCQENQIVTIYLKCTHCKLKPVNLDFSPLDVTAVCLLEGFQNQQCMILADRILKAIGKELAEKHFKVGILF